MQYALEKKLVNKIVRSQLGQVKCVEFHNYQKFWGKTSLLI